MKRFRQAIDLFWVVAFAAILIRLGMSTGGASASLARDIQLELSQGERQYGLYRAGERVGLGGEWGPVSRLWSQGNHGRAVCVGRPTARDGTPLHARGYLR